MRILRAKHISNKAKLGIYKAIITRVVLYDSELRKMNQREKGMLEI